MIAVKYRGALDVEKYNSCIKNSIQARIYAYSWYLDVVCDSWCALILNDYEAVMPLPTKKKFFLRYISHPFFCQQLGIFSLKELDSEMMRRFILAIPKKFVKINLQLNAHNNLLNGRGVFSKANYTLSLQDSYDSIFKSFSKGRKHAIKQTQKQTLRMVEDFELTDLVSIAKEYHDFKEIEDADYMRLQKLVAVLKSKGMVKLLGVLDEQDQLAGGAIFLVDDRRVTYLFSAITPTGRTLQVSSILLNHMIKKYSEKSLLLDFEGSEIPGVASFFKSFNAIKETYPVLKK